MIEPGITPVSLVVLSFPAPGAGDLRPGSIRHDRAAPGKDPFDSNQAIPTLDVRHEAAGSGGALAEVPELAVANVDWLSLAAYPLSGGFKRWCLVPAACGEEASAIEDRMPRLLRRLAGFRLLAVLERR